MPSVGTISTQIYPLPQTQDDSSIDRISHELIYATCGENAYLRQKNKDLEKEVELWQQLLSEKGQENTQLVSDLRHSQEGTVNLQASFNNMQLHLRQQAAEMTSVQKQNVKALRSKEHEQQKRREVKAQLEIERHRNAQWMGFVKVLDFMDPKDLEDLIGDKVDFDGVLAGHPTIARRVEKMKQENAAKDKVLKEYKGTHQHLCDMLHRLLTYHIGECNDRVLQ